MAIYPTLVFDTLAPVPALRVRGGKNSFYTPAKYREYKQFLCSYVKSQLAFLRSEVPPVGSKEREKYMAETRFMASILVYRKSKIGDQDNYAKCVQDALEDAGIIANDNQCDAGYCYKLVDKNHPRLEFTLVKLPKPSIISDEELALEMESALRGVWQKYES